MVQVQLAATLGAGGRTEYEVEAGNIMQLLNALKKNYPELEPVLQRGVAVAIDGQIYREALLQPIPPQAEVVLMPKLAAG